VQPSKFGFTCASLTTARHAGIVSGLLLLSYLVVTALGNPAAAAGGHIHSHHHHHSDADGSVGAAPSSGTMHMMMQMYFEARDAL
jgi:hypothetical protein